jgi:hypothetical protein
MMGGARSFPVIGIDHAAVVAVRFLESVIQLETEPFCSGGGLFRLSLRPFPRCFGLAKLVLQCFQFPFPLALSVTGFPDLVGFGIMGNFFGRLYNRLPLGIRFDIGKMPDAVVIGPHVDRPLVVGDGRRTPGGQDPNQK